MKEGLDEYVTKPIKKESILSVLNMFLQDKIVEETSITKPKPTPIKSPQVEQVKEEIKVVQEAPREEKSEIQKSLNIEMIQTQLEEIESPTKDILIYKKSPIETKIFASVLGKLTNSIDSINSIKELKEKLNENNYKVVLFDKELPSIEPSKMAELIKNIPAVMFVDPITKINDEDKELFISVIPNTINKKQLEELIQKFI